MTIRPTPFPSPSHDHDHCVRDALDAAESQCRRRGARLTALRRRVLELVWTSHEPIGAYAMLGMLRQEGYAAAPPTVYRALDFLLEHGLVHRLERMNAFVGCCRPETPHSAQFLICVQCGRVAELNDAAIDKAVARGAARLGFSVRGQTIEIEGMCADCEARVPEQV